MQCLKRGRSEHRTSYSDELCTDLKNSQSNLESLDILLKTLVLLLNVKSILTEGYEKMSSAAVLYLREGDCVCEEGVSQGVGGWGLTAESSHGI